jgi:transglutaminase-like putative cysteine protease
LRLRISHELVMSWDAPVRAVLAALRIMPRDHEGQTVVSWRIEPSIDGRLRSSDDAFGNLLHHFQAEGPLEALTLRAEGVIDTVDQAGTIRAARETAPPAVYMRETALTAHDEQVGGFALSAVSGLRTPLDMAHALMRAVAGRGRGTGSEIVNAASALRGEGDSAAGLAHLLCASARRVGLPARFVSGLANHEHDGRHVSGLHCWSELHIADLGWVGFDPILAFCPTDGHVRVAVGLDHADVMAARVAHVGNAGETISSRTVISVL